MSIITDQYQNKKFNYNISTSRKQQIIDLIGEVKNLEILDIGCATGYLGEYFKQRGNEVSGIDVSEEDLQIAENKLNEVYNFDLESNNWPTTLMGKKFDIIIAAEVLEHLIYPEKLLAKLKNLLRSTGYLLITTPNFLVWTNRLKMLFGKFTYQESGFWGRDHLHFFTWPELKKMLTNGGWKIVATNHLKHPKIPQFLAKIRSSLFAFQLIVKAKIK